MLRSQRIALRRVTSPVSTPKNARSQTTETAIATKPHNKPRQRVEHQLKNSREATTTDLAKIEQRGQREQTDQREQREQIGQIATTAIVKAEGNLAVRRSHNNRGRNNLKRRNNSYMRALNSGFMALMTMLFMSCTLDSQPSYVVDLDPTYWREAAEFTVPNTDTIDNSREISIFVRFQPSKERVDSLPLHIVTIAPDAERVVEQFTIYFKHKMGDQWRRRLYREVPYRRRVRLSQEGEYKILIYPHRPTHGVEAIGVAIKTIE